jgi:hypothetical protein
MAGMTNKTIAATYKGLLKTAGDNVAVPTGSTGVNVVDGEENVTALYLTDGEVGIGTASPAALLHVSSGASGDAGIIIEADTDNTAGTTGENYNPLLELRQDGNTLRGRFGFAGDVSHAGFYGDDIDNALYIESIGNDTTTTNIQFVTGGDLNAPTEGTARMTITDDGNVGIGTATPTQQLDVTKDVASAEFIALHLGNQQDDDDTSATVSIQFSPDTQQDNAAKIVVGKVSDFSTGANCDSFMAFHTIQNNGMSEQMRIMDSGNVGIGTASPGQDLDVENNQDASTAISINNPSTGSSADCRYSWYNSANNVNAIFYSTGHSLANKLVFTDSATSDVCFDISGNVGIGTATPDTNAHIKTTAVTTTYTTDAVIANMVGSGLMLHIENYVNDVDDILAGIEFTAYNAKAAIACTYDAQYDSSLVFGTSTADDTIAEHMRLDSTGKVGIGTVPSHHLHVLGDAGDNGTLVSLANSRSTVDDNDNILKLHFSGDSDGTSTEGNFIIFADYNTAEMGVIKAYDASIVVDSYSDYRLKDDVTTLNGGLDRVNNLRPVTFTYKTQSNKDNLHEGFIAHEVQEQVPYAVRGVKDAVKDDGSIKSQSFCIYQLIPQMVSAIQELSAKVTALENA